MLIDKYKNMKVYGGKGGEMTREQLKVGAAVTAKGTNKGNVFEVSATAGEDVYVFYYSEDGTKLLFVETVKTGNDAVWTADIEKADNHQYYYIHDGWSDSPNGALVENAQKAVSENRSLYAHFEQNLVLYLVYFYDGETLLETQEVAYGEDAVYSGDTSALGTAAKPFTYWIASPNNIQNETYCYAQYTPVIEDTITDSWETICANIAAAADGASCGYEIGDTKIVNFGGDCGPLAMQLVAVDMDDLADGTGKAKTTWLSRELGNTYKRMNPALASTTDEETNTTTYTDLTGTIGGWEGCEMRKYVQSLKANLPAALQNAIKNVTKTQQAFNTAGTAFSQSTTDDLWIPDSEELFNANSPVTYNAFFPDNASRIKCKVGTTSPFAWWCRNGYSVTSFRSVSGSGNLGNYNAYGAYGVVPGFCL